MTTSACGRSIERTTSSRGNLLEEELCQDHLLLDVGAFPPNQSSGTACMEFEREQSHQRVLEKVGQRRAKLLDVPDPQPQQRVRYASRGDPLARLRRQGSPPSGENRSPCPGVGAPFQASGKGWGRDLAGKARDLGDGHPCVDRTGSNRRFAYSLHRCTAKMFLALGSCNAELMAVERALAIKGKVRSSCAVRHGAFCQSFSDPIMLYTFMLRSLPRPR